MVPVGSIEVDDVAYWVLEEGYNSCVYFFSKSYESLSQGGNRNKYVISNVREI